MRSIIHTHDGLFLAPYGSITIFILVGPKALDTTFDVMSKSDLFRVNFSIPLLASMNGISFVNHKHLKFSHKGIVHVVHDTKYHPLVSYGGYSLDHFVLPWLVPSLLEQTYFIKTT